MAESFSDVWADARPLAGPIFEAPETERDSCGVAFVATLRGTPGRDIVDAGLSALLNLDHRGAFGEEMNSGDGAGILTQIPDAFLRDVIPEQLPPVGFYAIGLAFLPSDVARAEGMQRDVARLAGEEGLKVLAWRDVPVTEDLLSGTARVSLPVLRQLVVTSVGGQMRGEDLDRLTYRLRKRAEHETGLVFASLSARTLVYKGMLTTTQLEPFFPDLSDPRYASEIALVHARFSTGTQASWAQAQPMRFVAHNGEFTSIWGNRDWMRGREGTLEASRLGQIAPLLPICSPSGSDSMSFDEVVELLHLDGRSLPHAVLMLLPEAWEDDCEMGPDRRAFYDYHGGIVEPWDGPASLNFTDGTMVGTVLDRNALRPARFWVTEDGLVVLASETGVLDIDPAAVVRKGRVEPGRMFLVDTRQGRIIEDEEVKAFVAGQRPYAQWLAEHEVVLDQLVDMGSAVPSDLPTDAKIRMPADDGAPASVGRSRGAFFDRFTPLRARVTAAPLESVVLDLGAALRSSIGPEPNLLAETAEHARKLVLPRPVLDEVELGAVLEASDGKGFGLRGVRVGYGFFAEEGGAGLDLGIAELCRGVDGAIGSGVDVVVLSDQDLRAGQVPIPSLLALAAIHRHLVDSQQRGRISLIVECGEVRDGYDVARLLGFGAAAVAPYALLEGSREGAERRQTLDRLGAQIAELMFSFGTSTLKSYRGAQGFSIDGLSQEVLERFFPAAPAWAGAHGLDQIADDVVSGLVADGPATPRVGPWVSDRGSVPVEQVAAVAALREHITVIGSDDGAVLRVCPHRTGIDLHALVRARSVRIEFTACNCAGGLPTAAHLDSVSLEDLAQLIHDLKNANSEAEIQVVLPAQHGVGVLAAGAAKAHADSVVIAQSQSEHRRDGAGLRDVAFGIRESQEALIRYGLRARVRLGIDAFFQSAQDIVVAALLGAEQFGVLGSPTSRDLDGLAEELRTVLATLGRTELSELTGQDQLLSRFPDQPEHPEHPEGFNTSGYDPVTCGRGQDHGLDRALDHQLVAAFEREFTDPVPVALDVPVRNVNRSVGTLLGHHVAKRFGRRGLADDTITVTLTGSAGQSLGAFLPKGITLRLFGDANDFVGKGLSGGRIIVRPDTAAVLTGPDNVIAGNVIGYGATSGEVFLRGMAGDRFAARNQGANFVVEGVGANACQSMSAGTVVVLGSAGRHLGADMTGGVIYALDPHPGVNATRGDRPQNRELTDDDVESVVGLLRRHHESTGSTLAAQLLEDLPRIPERFTKISSSGDAPDRTGCVGSARTRT